MNSEATDPQPWLPDPRGRGDRVWIGLLAGAVGHTLLALAANLYGANLEGWDGLEFAILLVLAVGFIQFVYLGPALAFAVIRKYRRLLFGVVLVGLPPLLLSVFAIVTVFTK